MTQNNNWLRYRAKDGVLETHFYADGGWSGYSSFVEKALELSDSDPGESNSEYKLLDTFFSDSMSEVLLQQIFERASDSSPARMLVVDPTCPFAEHRATSIGGSALERAHRGLKVIATALKISTPPRMNALDPDDPLLLALIHQVKEKAHVSVQFYSVSPSGPLYFFKNIVLCGRFCSGKSAIRLPWSIIVNDPDRPDDLYDILNDEFEEVWNRSYEYPGTWLQKKKRVFLSYSEHDQALAREIHQRFQENDIPCFMASHDLLPGVLWTEELRKNISESAEFVVLLTPESISSAWVQAELGAAWALNLNITPAVVQMRLAAVLQFVGSHQAIDVSTTEGKEALINAVVTRMCKRFGDFQVSRVPR